MEIYVYKHPCLVEITIQLKISELMKFKIIISHSGASRGNTVRARVLLMFNVRARQTQEKYKFSTCNNRLTLI